jgi:outer membrane protein insertion porin family
VQSKKLKVIIKKQAHRQMNKAQKDKGTQAKNSLISLYLFTGFLLFTMICSYGCATSKPVDVATDVSAENNGRKIIKSIDFIGNDTVTAGTLLKKLDFKVGNYLDAIQVESGSSVISEFYRLKGYPDVRVTQDLAELSLGNVVYIIEEGQRIAIKSVSFEGNDRISTGNLKSIIKTGTRSWLFWPVYYTKEKIAADEQRLRQAYYKRGFLNHKITAVGRDDIVFQIEEGPQYKVGKVSVSGNKYFDADSLLTGFELKEGQVYLPPKASAYAQKILDRYNQNGFINAQVEYRHLFRNQDSDIVDIEFGITEGTQFRIGKIDITGNEQTQDKVYRHILDEYDFTPGQLYDAKLAPVQGEGKLHRYLKQMTMAEEVLISPVSPTDTNDSLIENRKDVRINVKEGLTGLLSPGVTVGTDSGVIGRFIITQNNFDITDWPESTEEFLTMKSFTGAGQSLRLALEPGTEVSYYSLSFTEPYFLDKPVSFDVEGSLFERWYESYDEKRKRIYTGFEKRYKSGWRNNLGFSFQNVRVARLDYDAPQEIVDVKGNNLLIGVDVGVGLDKTNDRFVPSAGYKLKFDYEQTTGDFDFGTVSGSTVFYKTLFEDFTERKTVLATKFLAAATESDAPPFEKFYAGGGMGTYSLRGFEYRGISTRGLQTNVPEPVRKDPIGSDWVFLANTELSVPLLGENVSGLLFLDSGTIDTGPYRSSVGIGLQIMIPNILGPVPMRFSYAFPLKKDDSDETQHFSFFMGRLF